MGSDFTMIKNFIFDRWTTGSTDRVVRNHNPSTGAPCPLWNSAGDEQVDAAVKAARDAAASWAATPLAEREVLLTRFAAIAGTGEARLVDAIQQEAGKPRWEAQQEAKAVGGKVALSIQAYAQRCAAFGSGPSRTRFKPHGVLAVLGPFNFPAHLPNGHIVPALLAGNTVVFKPSERVPLAAQLMAEFWAEAGLPAGVLNVVQGDGDTGAYLAGHDDLDGLLFTGGSKIGEALRRDFALKPEKLLALELGGNNPLVVWKPEDLDLAVNLILQSAYVTAGQRCTCARRLIIPTGADGEGLLERLAAAIDGLRLGSALAEPQVFMGPVINAATALALVAKQASLVQAGAIAIRALRHLEVGTGLVSPGLLDVTAIKELADEEWFGPLLVVHRVDTFAEAITEATRTRYGLAAGLISPSAAHYDAFAAQVRAGIINWNTSLTGASGAAPFGGLGLSGNHRPSGFFAADYCSYAVASLEADRLNPTAPLPPGLRPD
jgi:succinylglutamic semialdehyde dehydrogenase